MPAVSNKGKLAQPRILNGGIRIAAIRNSSTKIVKTNKSQVEQANTQPSTPKRMMPIFTNNKKSIKSSAMLIKKPTKYQ